jgi:phospholipid transport system transporter-binding protein
VNAIKVSIDKNEMQIIGALTQDTVMSVLQESVQLLPSNAKLTINLSGVERCDSASLALLSALMRACKDKSTQLQFSHLPSQMRQIASVSGLDNILPIAES